VEGDFTNEGKRYESADRSDFTVAWLSERKI
jgi:hypothetical protein